MVVGKRNVYAVNGIHVALSNDTGESSSWWASAAISCDEVYVHVCRPTRAAECSFEASHIYHGVMDL